MKNTTQFLINSYFVFRKSVLTPFYGPKDHFLFIHQHFQKHIYSITNGAEQPSFSLFFYSGASTRIFFFCHDLPLRGFAIKLIRYTPIGRTPLDVRHPQHTQTSSSSSTIAADSSNGVTNTRCCRYSCMRS